MLLSINFFHRKACVCRLTAHHCYSKAQWPETSCWNLDIFGKNLPTGEDSTFKVTEFFYDADCMNLSIKDKHGKIYDFTDLTSELYDGLKRKTVFDTSGWYHKNPILQKRAEKYVEFFAKPEHTEKLAAINISFNVFNASYIASVKAARNGDYQKAQRLRERYVDNMANTLFTFSPIANLPNFHVMSRCFSLDTKNAKSFGVEAMFSLINDVQNKLTQFYIADLNGTQKYVKSPEDIDKLLQIYSKKMERIDTGLNSAGRMKDFLKEFNIKANLQNHDEIKESLIADLSTYGRHHRYLAHKLIDTAGKVYHMNYAWFVPTEVQLNLENKNIKPPKLANLIDNYTITKETLNRPEIQIIRKV